MTRFQPFGNRPVTERDAVEGFSPLVPRSFSLVRGSREKLSLRHAPSRCNPARDAITDQRELEQLYRRGAR